MNYFLKYFQDSTNRAYHMVLKIKKALNDYIAQHLVKERCRSLIKHPPTYKKYRPQHIKAIVIRPTARDREYAREHIEAFVDDPIRDPINKKIFQIQLEAENKVPGRSSSWEEAKKWWEDLYSETIDDQSTKSTASNNPFSSEALAEWYQKIQSPQQQNLTPPKREVLLFIKHWWNKLGNSPDQTTLNQHQLDYKKLLLRHHPDKNGCADATALLLEWRKIAKQKYQNSQQLSKLPISMNTIHRYSKAKPWKVYSLFAKHQTAVVIQKLHNQTQEANLQKERLQREIENLLENQKALIQSLQQQLQQVNP